MALIVFKTGKRKFVPAEQGAKVWEVFNGDRQGSDKERAYCEKVHKIYLNKHNAPITYLAKFADRLTEERWGSYPQAPEIRLPFKD